eukprot:TRINITY_DN3679_c0_g1_i1.p1 TRINITY_DN3679_c0_g1~~TRINITY_DN3679_c0_g1_i1.p1  ORF type:complete len:563 (-),score=208.60 TRINITY_DN3679_c0_g1_i1:427-2115(-)
MPVVQPLVVDENVQVRCVAADSLQMMCALMDPHNPNSKPSTLELLRGRILALAPRTASDRLPEVAACGDRPASFLFHSKVQPLLLELSENEEMEEHRVIAAELLHKIALVFPSYLNQELLHMLVRSSSDAQFRVRKAVALALGPCCLKLGNELVKESGLPTFLQLCGDDIWGVRKACAESLVSLSQSVSSEEREHKLVPVFEKFTTDLSRWVRTSAYQNLGPLIATFEPGCVPSRLLECFISMKGGNEFVSGGSDIVLHCAYSFPGVLLTVGAEGWGELKELYSHLSQDLQWKVRQTLSYSLHEVARVIGTAATEEDLLPAFDLFLKDLDQVKLGVVTHLSAFLKVLSPDTRQNYVAIVEEIQAESVNWRFRRLIAQQLKEIATLMGVDTIRSSVIPMASELCLDQVARVREAAVKDIGPLLLHVRERDESLLSELVSALTQLAENSSCIHRQTFAHLCEQLAPCIPPEMFAEIAFPALRTLASDPAANVRFVCARALAQHVDGKDGFGSIADEVAALIARLKEDGDREVRYFAHWPLRPPDEFTRNPQEPQHVVEEDDDEY